MDKDDAIKLLTEQLRNVSFRLAQLEAAADAEHRLAGLDEGLDLLDHLGIEGWAEVLPAVLPEVAWLVCCHVHVHVVCEGQVGRQGSCHVSQTKGSEVRQFPKGGPLDDKCPYRVAQ